LEQTNNTFMWVKGPCGTDGAICKYVGVKLRMVTTRTFLSFTATVFWINLIIYAKSREAIARCSSNIGHGMSDRNDSRLRCCHASWTEVRAGWWASSWKVPWYSTPW